MLAAAGPSSLAVALFAGTYVTILAAACATAGFVVRYLGSRLKNIDAGQVEILRRVGRVEDQLPDVTGRVRVLERGHKKHRKILDRMSWVLEVRETATQDAQRVARTGTRPSRARPGNIRDSGATET